MKDTLHISSLRPYLETHKALFALHLSPISDDSSVMEKAPFPFRIISDAAPLTRLIEARLITGAISEIKRVFLLVQKDSYSLAGDAMLKEGVRRQEAGGRRNTARPLNNQDIDNAWQNAFSSSRHKESNNSAIILPHQVDRQEEKERLMPFQPLFYCRQKKLFFEPPCPKCGTPLRQCYDDDLLIRSGLLPYSTSLKRYLYCPACADSKEAGSSSGGCDFYTFALESLDPPWLMDRRDLIRRFGHLIEGKDNPDLREEVRSQESEVRRQEAGGRRYTSHFPCLKCAGNRECYGPDSRCLSRVLPFAFYSFYLLTFEAMSIHALDFLALVSGASFEELETGLTTAHESGRAECLKAVSQRHKGQEQKHEGQGQRHEGQEQRHKGTEAQSFFSLSDFAPLPLRALPLRAFTFFNQGERYFYEVLYLKLSFLGEFLQTALPGLALDRQPDQGLSLDRIWVRLGSQSGFLPLFWNFSLGAIDIDIHSLETSLSPRTLPRTLPLSSLYFLGLAWFSTFLVNHNQNSTLVHQSLEEAVSESRLSDHTSDLDLAKRSQTFFAENIFWYPERGIIPKSGRIFWEKCLNLGWSLLNASYHDPSQWSKEAFWEQFETLREEVKDALFQGKEAAGDQLSVAGEDETVSDQLPVANEQLPIASEQLPIASKKPVISDQLPVISEKTDNFKLKTDNFSGDPGENKAIHDILIKILNQWRSGMDEKQEISTELEETVMLSPESLMAKTTSSSIVADGHTAPAREEDVSLETVIISPQKQPFPVSPQKQPFPMTQGTTGAQPAPGPEAKVSPEKFEQVAPVAPVSEEDGLLETVIISPQRQPTPVSPQRQPFSVSPQKQPFPMTQGTIGAQPAARPEAKVSPEKSEQVAPVAPEREEDGLLETVIISPQKQSSPVSPQKQPSSTMVQGPSVAQPAPGVKAEKPEQENPALEPEHEDFLTETVILSSKTFQDYNKKENS